MSEPNATSEEERIYPELPDTFYFWFYLCLLIPAIICSIFVLYHLVLNRALRNALHNHIIIVIVLFSLIYQVTAFPWMLHHYHVQGEWERSLLFCRVWGFLDWSLYTVNAMLFAWSTMERHILIFHDRWVSTRLRRLYFHYLPMILILLYTFILYAVVYFFPPCGYLVYKQDSYCFSPCLKYDTSFIAFETIVNQIVPVFLILIFATLLVLRTLWSKYRLGQRIQWRRHRKLIIQSIAVSVLYLICVFPTAVVYIVMMTGVETDAVIYALLINELMTYLPALLLPMVIGVSSPDIRAKFLAVLFPRGRRIVPHATIQPLG